VLVGQARNSGADPILDRANSPFRLWDVGMRGTNVDINATVGGFNKDSSKRGKGQIALNLFDGNTLLRVHVASGVQFWKSASSDGGRRGRVNAGVMDVA